MKNRHEPSIAEAADILQLGDWASLGEIRRAYHRLSKLYHPDTAQESHSDPEKMHQLTIAYEILVAYCHEYRVPLRQEEQDPLYDPAEWWSDRFGENIFGSKTSRKSKKR